VALAHFQASRVGEGFKYAEVLNGGKEHLRAATEIKRKLFSEAHYRHLEDFGDEDEQSYIQLVPWMVW
jgi:hypothetical protein